MLFIQLVCTNAIYSFFILPPEYNSFASYAYGLRHFLIENKYTAKGHNSDQKIFASFHCRLLEIDSIHCSLVFIFFVH